jgi:chromosome partitioning protein
MKIAVCNQKGGVGKTTIAVNLAVHLADQGFTLIDADRQESAYLWAKIRADAGIKPEIQTKRIHKATLHKELTGNAVIDCGGRDSEVLRSALLAADLVLVPSRPSQFDLWSLESMNDLIADAGGFNQELKGIVVWNQAATNPGVHDDQTAAKLVRDLESLDLAGTVLRSRVAYARSASEGQSVEEFEPRGKAAGEISSLFREIMKWV